MTILIYARWPSVAILDFVKRFFKFRIDLIYFFENIAISIFLSLGLKLPNRSHFFMGLGGIDTLNKSLCKISGKNITDLRYTESPPAKEIHAVMFARPRDRDQGQAQH